MSITRVTRDRGVASRDRDRVSSGGTHSEKGANRFLPSPLPASFFPSFCRPETPSKPTPRKRPVERATAPLAHLRPPHPHVTHTTKSPSLPPEPTSFSFLSLSTAFLPLLFPFRGLQRHAISPSAPHAASASSRLRCVDVAWAAQAHSTHARSLLSFGRRLSLPLPYAPLSLSHTNMHARTPSRPRIHHHTSQQPPDNRRARPRRQRAETLGLFLPVVVVESVRAARKKRRRHRARRALSAAHQRQQPHPKCPSCSWRASTASGASSAAARSARSTWAPTCRRARRSASSWCVGRAVPFRFLFPLSEPLHSSSPPRRSSPLRFSSALSNQRPSAPPPPLVSDPPPPSFELNTQQESVKARHPQLLYESKLYKILQGGGEEEGSSSEGSSSLVVVLSFALGSGARVSFAFSSRRRLLSRRDGLLVGNRASIWPRNLPRPKPRVSRAPPSAPPFQTHRTKNPSTPEKRPPHTPRPTHPQQNPPPPHETQQPASPTSAGSASRASTTSW